MKLKDRKFIVYRHTNKTNNKVYVGITCQSDPNKRWRNGEGYSSQIVFYRAIKKYGWNNFKHEVLYSGLSNCDALDIEKELIAYYKNLKISYNMSDGYDYTPDTSVSIDVYNVDKTFIGNFKSIEEAAKMLKVSATGLHAALTHYKGVSKCKNYVVVYKGETPNFNNIKTKGGPKVKVAQYENDKLIKIYNSFLEAGNAVGVSAGAIYNATKNFKKSTSKGYYWKVVK